MFSEEERDLEYLFSQKRPFNKHHRGQEKDKKRRRCRNHIHHRFFENPLTFLYGDLFGYFLSIPVSETHSERSEVIY